MINPLSPAPTTSNSWLNEDVCPKITGSRFSILSYEALSLGMQEISSYIRSGYLRCVSACNDLFSATRPLISIVQESLRNTAKELYTYLITIFTQILRSFPALEFTFKELVITFYLAILVVLSELENYHSDFHKPPTQSKEKLFGHESLEEIEGAFLPPLDEVRSYLSSISHVFFQSTNELYDALREFFHLDTVKSLLIELVLYSISAFFAGKSVQSTLNNMAKEVSDVNQTLIVGSILSELHTYRSSLIDNITSVENTIEELFCQTSSQDDDYESTASSESTGSSESIHSDD
jgi:hypothetical protein